MMLLVLFALICVGFALYDAARQIRGEVIRAETLKLCEQRYAQYRRELIQLGLQAANGNSNEAAYEYAMELKDKMQRTIEAHARHSYLKWLESGERQ